MGNKFSEYSSTSQSNSTYKDTTNSSHKNIEDMYKKYSQYSESELMQEFIKMSSKKKANGELNDTVIDTYKKTLYPYLTDEQKRTFESLINVVK